MHPMPYGFSELLLILVLIVIIVGPENLRLR